MDWEGARSEVLALGAMLLVSVGLAVASAQAEPPAPPLPLPTLAARLSEGWRWREIAPPPSTPESVSSLAFDKDERLLLGTDVSLARFDGYRWNEWRFDSMPEAGYGLRTFLAAPFGLISANETSVFEWRTEPKLDRVAEHRSALVVECPDHRLFLISASAVEERLIDRWHRVGDGPVEKPRSAACLSDGSLLAETVSGLSISANGVWKRLPTPFTPEASYRIIASYQDRVLLASDRSPLAHFPLLLYSNSTGWQQIPSPTPLSSPVSALLLDRSTPLLSTGDGAVRVWEGGSWQIVESPQLNGDLVLKLAISPLGRVALATVSGRVLSIDLNSRRWMTLEASGGIGLGACNAIERSADGSIWAGCEPGLVRLRNGALLERHPKALGERLQMITTILELPRGEVWVGSGSGFAGAYRLDHGSWERHREPEGIGASHVHAIRRGTDGSIWFLLLPDESEMGRGALAHYKDGRWRRFGPADGLTCDRAYELAFDRSGRMIVAGREQIFRFDGSRFSAVPSPPGRFVPFALHPAKDGTIWIGSGRLTPGIFSYDGQTVSRAAIPALRTAGASQFLETRHGWLAIASFQGLRAWTGSRLLDLTREPGLPSLLIWPMLQATDGEGGGLWLGTHRGGLTLYTPDDHTPPLTTYVAVGNLADGETPILSWQSVDRWNETTADLLTWRITVDGLPVETPIRRYLPLENLDPGPHLVEIHSVDLLDNVEVGGIRKSFVMPRPGWQQTRNLVLIGLSLLVLAAGAVLLLRARRERRLQRRRFTEALIASEKLFRELVEQSAIVFWQYDGAGNLIYVSPQFETLSGVPRGLIMSELTRLERWIEDGEEAQRLARARALGQPAVIDAELQLRTVGGPPRMLHARQSRVQRHDGSVSFDVVALDVTEQRRLERAMAHSQRLESLGQMAGGIAHDFNNLLTIVLGNAALLKEAEVPGAAARSQLDAITLAAERAAGLCRRMLAFAGRQQSEANEVDLNALLADSMPLLRASVSTATEIEIDIPGGPLVTQGDRALLIQTVINLALNGAESMPAQGGRLRIGLRPVRLESARLQRATLGQRLAPGWYAELMVADNGHGIPPELLSRIFDPFFSTRFAGRGLGLAAVLGIVRMHHGCIEIESAVGKGTTFRILLPIEQAATSSGSLARGGAA